jgi:flagellum-specific peptidoglycan hydrolase FlgJ
MDIFCRCFRDMRITVGEMTKTDFLTKAKQAAMNIGHPWPGYVAAECALESRYGDSLLAREANNLLGMKIHHATLPGDILELPTREWVNGSWLTVTAHWMKYPDWEACLRDRWATLQRMPQYYLDAVNATTGEQFVREVSRHWSTDPHRADKVLEIYAEHADVLA